MKCLVENRIAMKSLILFVYHAVRTGHAYFDIDGCLLKKMPVPIPEQVAGDRLKWWQDNLEPTPIVRSRLALAYLLWALGVRLALYTNRDFRHMTVTRKAFGRHYRIFTDRYYEGGKKYRCQTIRKCKRRGPLIDDDVRFLGAVLGDYLVKSK